MRLFGFLLATTVVALPLHEGLAKSEPGSFKLTAYSASCRYDSHGGRNTSPSGLKPRSYTVDGRSSVVMAAVTQRGGSKSLEGCFFRIKLAPSKSKLSARERKKIEGLREKIEKKVFFGGDKYGSGSNYQQKIDLSYECSRGLGNLTFHGARIERLNCPGLRARKKVLEAIDRMSRVRSDENFKTEAPRRGFSFMRDEAEDTDPFG